MFLGVSEFEMPCEENHMLLIFEKKNFKRFKRAPDRFEYIGKFKKLLNVTNCLPFEIGKRSASGCHGNVDF